MGLFDRRHHTKVTARRIIDLRDTPAPRRPDFGFPTPCPECRTTGYLDHIDPFRREMLQHCPACMAKWVVTEAELQQA